MDVAGWARHTSRQACIATWTRSGQIYAEAERRANLFALPRHNRYATKNGAAFDGAPLFIFFTPAPASHAPIREIRDSLMKAT